MGNSANRTESCDSCGRKMDKRLCVIVLLLTEMLVGLYGNIIQLESVLSVHEGDSAVFSCIISSQQVTLASWYKQDIGEEPRLIASSIFQSSKSQFHNEFNNNRFEVSRGTDHFNLKIKNTVQSDSATYYCATAFSNIMEFGNGTRLVIRGGETSNLTHLQLPKLELVESAVNVSLQCSIQNQLVSGGGEHRLYWFRHGSGESPPGSVYIHANTSDQCASSETDCLLPTCAYKIPEKTSSSSDKEAYYCALVTCGEALFGNASKMNHDDFKSQKTHVIFLIGLTVLLTSNITINIVLCCMRKESINAIDSKYQQIQSTDDDVSIIQYEEVNFRPQLYCSTTEE